MKINEAQFSVIFRYLEETCWLKTTEETRCNVYRDSDYIIVEPAEGTSPTTFYHADNIATICAPFNLSWYISYMDGKTKAFILIP